MQEIKSENQKPTTELSEEDLAFLSAIQDPDMREKIIAILEAP